MGPSVYVVGLPILASSILLACLGLLQRVALKGKDSPAPYMVLSYGLTALGGVIIYLLSWGVTMPSRVQEGFWVAAVAGPLVGFGLQYFHAKAVSYDSGEVSLVAPLSATTPGLVAILAITLGEFPSRTGILGIVFMALGSWVLLFKEKPEQWWGYLVPLQRMLLLLRYRSLSPKDQERAKVVACAFASASLSTFGLLAVGLYVRLAGDLQGIWMAIVFAWVVLAGSFALQALWNGPEKGLVQWRGQQRMLVLSAVGYAILLIAASRLEVPVFGETFVAYVGTLNRSRILFSVVLVYGFSRLGFSIFGEEDLKKRMVAALFITAGAILITTEGLPERLTHKLQLFGF